MKISDEFVIRPSFHVGKGNRNRWPDASHPRELVHNRLKAFPNEYRMAIPVVEFSREGYKIRNIFGKKSKCRKVASTKVWILKEVNSEKCNSE